jgi:pimeloyl-ACP methyl ester carboxylesterase
MKMKMTRLACVLFLMAAASCGKKTTSDPAEEGKQAITKETTVKSTETEPTKSSEPATAIPEPTATVKVSDKDELDVWVVGEGTPVVLVHGALFYYLLRPLAEELAKTGDYKVIWYNRRGYRGEPTEPSEVSDQARDIVKILDELEISKAHVLGHSAGGHYVLELALQAPDRLLSAAMLDFTFSSPKTEPGAMIFKMAGPAIEKAQAGDFEGAAAAMLVPMGISKELIERELPGSWSAMAKDAQTWFTMDIPALGEWLPTPAKVKAIDVPLAFLSVGKAGPMHMTGQLLKKWRPNLTMLESSATDHFFPITATAEGVAVIDNWIKSQGTAN